MANVFETNKKQITVEEVKTKLDNINKILEERKEQYYIKSLTIDNVKAEEGEKKK